MPRPPYSDEAIEAKKRDSRERFQAELGFRPKNIKNIEDLKTTFYPTSVDPPDLELSFSVEPGRFRYHRSFLLQFKDVCKEKPASLPPLDVFGLNPGKTGVAYAGGGSRDMFGKISKPTGIRFGPSSVFSKKDTSNRGSSVGRAGVANMFSALSMGTIGTADGPPPPVERTMSSHRPSAGLEPGGSSTPAVTGERRVHRLLPGAKPTEAKANKAEEKEEERKDAVLGTMTGEV
ncbi:hypothetical protein RSAG8_12521, partial [Rhizoctonia solani AG-8 WAC10335]